MVAETPSTAQHNGIGISSIRSCGFGAGAGAGVTVTGAAGVSMAGKLINGCVFFICTAGFGCGSGKTVMRAVSFFGDGVVIGAGIAAVATRAGEGKSTGRDVGFAGGRVGK
ncbi:MAG: hypothetical protein QOE81_1338 [Verrucomicrobiota bacterium]